MSLAGKILTVLSTLALLGWIYLFASVANLENQWGKAIEKQDEQIVSNTKTLSETDIKAFAASEELNESRADTDYEVETLRVGIEDLQDRVAQDRETLARAGFRLDSEKALVVNSQAAVQRRAEEKAALQSAVAALQVEINALEQEESQLFERLNGLMSQFERVMAENRQFVERRGGSSAPAAPASSRVPGTIVR